MINIDFNNIEYLEYPFPHCIIDNFLDIKKANEIHNEIMTLNLKNADRKYINNKDLRQYNKFGFSKIKNMIHTQNIFKYLNSKNFISKIEKLSGITNLIYDNSFLRGAGIHIIKNKGYLAMHTDFNTYNHDDFGLLDRRINLLIYFNKDWCSNYKGDLLMINRYDKQKLKRIEPIFNRCVIFNTTNKSIHGHPETLNLSNHNIYRKSIAVYYYTKNTNKNVDFEGDPPHSTLWYNFHK